VRGSASSSNLKDKAQSIAQYNAINAAATGSSTTGSTASATHHANVNNNTTERSNNPAVAAKINMTSEYIPYESSADNFLTIQIHPR
jgi:hypothetical protein